MTQSKQLTHQWTTSLPNIQLLFSSTSSVLFFWALQHLMLLSTLGKRRSVQLRNEQSQQSLQGHLSRTRGALLGGIDLHYSFLCRVNIHSDGTYSCGLSGWKTLTGKAWHTVIIVYWRALQGLWELLLYYAFQVDINYIVSSRCLTAY